MSEACRNKFQQHSSYMLSSWQIYLGLNFPLKSRLFRKQVFLCRNHSFCSFSTSFRQQQWKQEPHDQNMSHLKPVIRPTSKLHLAVLVVEGEPGDVDLAGGHEDAGRDVGAQPLVRHHHISRVGSVKGLTRTEIMESCLRRHTYFLGY